MGAQPAQNKSLFSELVEAVIDRRLGDFLREREISSQLLTSKIREGNIHGSAWQTMLQHIASANQLGEAVDALQSYGETITPEQLNQASRTGMTNLISQSQPEQARVIADILKTAENPVAYGDIIAPAPDYINHHIVSTRFDTLQTLLGALEHTLQPDDIFREDNTGRTILQTSLMDPEQSQHMLAFLKETGTEIPMEELEKFYSTHQSHLGQTARTLMAVVTDKGNAETLLHLPVTGGKPAIVSMTEKHFGDILGAMPSAESARGFLNSPAWRSHYDAHGKALNALLESKFNKDDDHEWVQELVSRAQIQRSKELISRRRRQKSHKPRMG